MPPSNKFFFDLNNEPYEENDTPIEEGLYQLIGVSYQMEEDPNPSEEGSQMEDETTNNAGSHINGKNKDLTNERRRLVFEMLLLKSVDGKLGNKTTREVASVFSISMRTVQRIWKQGKESLNGDVSNKRKNCGRKEIEFDNEKFRKLPLKKRTTIKSIAYSLNISASVVERLLKNGLIRRHSNTIKPFLKEENKRARLRFCLSVLEENSLQHNPVFKCMYNMIHIDEKWFYLTKQKENYYLLPDEDEPLRTCTSKNFITKVMFLAAVARPRFDMHGNVTFTGKIGIFPFVTREPARRSSANRVAGTMETKSITSVKREDMRSFLIGKVIPAVKEKWPVEDRTQPIFIQQDNARTHVDPTDNEFCEEARKDGFDIRLMCQPPNSPDLNILDLGFFNAIQSLQEKETATTVDELVEAVIKSFEAFSPILSNRIWLTLHQCMIEIMKGRGGHNYKMQHINKAKLESEGNLPIQLRCDAAIFQDVIRFLS